MWKIFRRDKYASIRRHKRLEEKQRMRERSRAHHRRKRAERWQRFRKRWNRFLAHPFALSEWKTRYRNPYSPVDRQKQREEKKRRQERSRAYHRRQRAEQWQRFRRRFNRFFALPFSKKRRKSVYKDPNYEADRIRQREERKRLRQRSGARQRRKRIEQWQKFQKRVREFLANPFAKRELTSTQREQRRVRRYKRHNRKVTWQRWWARFKKDPWKTLFPPRRLRMPGGGYRYAFRLSKKERKEIARRKRKQLRENLLTVITTADLRRKFGFAYLHSSAYFILAFMLIYVIYQVITIVVASSYHIPVVWYYYQLKFPLYTYSPLYTRQALIVIFAVGPIMSLMLAFVFLRLYFSTNPVIKRFQLFYLWGFICGANMFFGAYIAGFITQTEFIYTSAWLFMSPMYATEEIIFSIIAIGILVLIGRLITPLFLLSSGSVTLVKPEFRLFFVLSQVILPWLTAMIVLFLITLPDYYFPLILKTISPGLALIPTLFVYNSVQFDNIHRSGVIQHNYFKWSIVIVVVAVLFFYRVLLSFGLSVS